MQLQPFVRVKYPWNKSLSTKNLSNVSSLSEQTFHAHNFIYYEPFAKKNEQTFFCCWMIDLDTTLIIEMRQPLYTETAITTRYIV